MKLYAAVSDYVNADPARFHTPGHKGRRVQISLPDVNFDITELPGIGSLYDSDGPIRESEQEMAAVYGAADTFYSAGGATLCIQAMLALSGAKKIIMGRGAHLSAHNAMALLDIVPVWFYPDGKAGSGLPGRYDPEILRMLLGQHPDAGAVYITSPDYYGCLSDISALAAVCREYGVPLLVDNAHGSHLPFCGETHPIAAADWCCDSAHKTLPVLTGGAMLHTRHGGRASEVKAAMELFGSTSPSFLTLLSLDQCADYLKERGNEDFLPLCEKVSELKEAAALAGFTLPEGPCDPIRLTVGCDAPDDELSVYFQNLGISCEYLRGGWAVFLLSPSNTEEELKRLKSALMGWNGPKGLPPAGFMHRPRLILSPRQAVFSPKETLDVESCVGRVCAGVYASCPPGIPIVSPGEQICEKIIKFLCGNGTKTVNVVK